MSNLKVGYWRAVFINAGHEVPDHIVRVFFDTGLPTSANDFEIGLGHFMLRIISFSIMG